MSDAHRHILIGLLRDGIITVAEVAATCAVSVQAVHRWVDAEACKRARAQTAALIIEAALHPDRREARRGRPTREEARQMRIVSQKNPKKDVALRKVRTGAMTIPQAARLAGVPVSGMVGWCRQEHIAVPAEYDAPRRAARQAPAVGTATRRDSEITC